MGDKIYTVTLADGTKLTGLKMNGNNFVSLSPIDPDIFEYNTAVVTIESGSEKEVHENMELVQVTQMGEEYWFVLIDIPKDKLVLQTMQAQLDYVQMMAGVE